MSCSLWFSFAALTVVSTECWLHSTLVDITGNVTTWGHFSATEITGFLLVAHRVTGKEEYLDALEPLLERDGKFSIGFPRYQSPLTCSKGSRLPS